MKVLIILGAVCFLVVAVCVLIIIAMVVRILVKGPEKKRESPLAAMFRQGREDNARRRREAAEAMAEDDPLREWVGRGGAIGWVGFDRNGVHFYDEPDEQPDDLLGAVRGVRYFENEEPDLEGLPAPDCSFGIDFSGRPVSNRSLSMLAEHNGMTAINLFNSHKVSDVSLKVVRRMTDLVTLDLQITDVTGRGMEYLTALPALRYLAVGVSEDFDIAVRHLREMTQLVALVGGSAITDKDLRGLAPLANLTHLELSSSTASVSDAGVRHLQAFPRLLNLKLVSRQLTDDALAHFPVLGALQKLELTTHKEGAGGLDLAAIVRLSALQELRLPHNALTGAGFEHFAGLPRLKLIDLSNNPIRDKGFARLRVPPTLEHLMLNYTKITDASLAKLELPPSVTNLDLQGVPVTDASIPHLARFTSLSHLSLVSTKFTYAGAERLSEALPYCTIVTPYPKPSGDA